jgi:hypothetical protein
MPRRGFLRHTAAAAAMLTGPLAVPSSVLGYGRPSPSNRITMGFIGLGGQGGGHLFGGGTTYLVGGYLGRDQVQVLGVCDVWRHKREAARQRVNQYYAEQSGNGSYTACVAYNDFRDLLARPDLDAVLIATPNHWHAMMTIVAAKAGKDVYCEKPTAVTIRESQAEVEAVRRYGRVFQAGTQQRSEYGGKFRLACELVRSGRIGRLQCVYANIGGAEFSWAHGFGPAKPVPDGLDWDLYLGPAPWSPYGTISASPNFDGGNWEQHHYDIVQWALDADRTGPVEIGKEEGKVVYRYGNGVVVYGCGYPGEKVGRSGGACFVGSEGRIAVDRDNLVAYPAKILQEPLGPDDVHLYKSTSHSGNFLECIRSRQPTICDVTTAHRAVSVVLLGGVAQHLGRTVKWHPQQERFIDDAEAGRLLSVATRPPWRL